jgi:hypothetical protein
MSEYPISSDSITIILGLSFSLQPIVVENTQIVITKSNIPEPLIVNLNIKSLIGPGCDTTCVPTFPWQYLVVNQDGIVVFFHFKLHTFSSAKVDFGAGKRTTNPTNWL